MVVSIMCMHTPSALENHASPQHRDIPVGHCRGMPVPFRDGNINACMLP